MRNRAIRTRDFKSGGGRLSSGLGKTGLGFGNKNRMSSDVSIKKIESDGDEQPNLDQSYDMMSVGGYSMASGGS
jgi:hypothetical protein